TFRAPAYFNPKGKLGVDGTFPVGDEAGGDQKNLPEKESKAGEGQGRSKVKSLTGHEPGLPAPPTAPAGNAPGESKKEPPQQPEPVPASRKIIRTGDVEFEIDQFDSGVAAVTKLINAIPGAFIATINSDKLANGKVKGSIVVRMPPERLDKFLL